MFSQKPAQVYLAAFFVAVKLETTKVPFSRRMDKLVHPDSGTRLGVKRNELHSHENTWRKHKRVY